MVTMLQSLIKKGENVSNVRFSTIVLLLFSLQMSYLCIKEAALGQAKASFIAARLHCLCIKQSKIYCHS
jgi:hypothetical protein